MKYSIVIISKDNRKFLTNCLKHLLKVVPKDVEIIVVEANDSLDNLPFESIKHIRIPQKHAGYSNQRNIGVRNSNGEYIIFVDDDVEVSPDWFTNLTKTVEEDKNVLGCMGSVFPKEANILSFSLSVLGHPGGGFKLFDNSDGNVVATSLISTGNAIFRKSIIEEVNYFDEEKSKFGSEDTEICMRIEKKYGSDKLRYNPQAIVWHYTPDRFYEIVKWYIRRGKKDIEIVLKHKLSLKYLMSSSIIAKIFIVLFLGLFIGINFLLLTFVLWYLWQLYKYRFMLKYLKYYPNFKYPGIVVLICFPLVKFIVDIAFDIGRSLAIMNNFKNKKRRYAST